MSGSKVFAALAICTILPACGGGGGGTSGDASLAAFAARWEALNGDMTLSSPTMQSTVDARMGTVNYLGVINVSTQDPANPAGTTFYYGNISIDVAFNDDSLSGDAGGFVQYFSEVASPDTGSSVPGSLDITGSLLPNNESLGDGITGTASGSINGFDITYDMDGNITGVNANAMTLSFDGPDLSGGVAILVE